MVTRLSWTAKPARVAALAALLVLLPAAGPVPGPALRLASGLRQLYGGSAQPWERWGRRSAVRLPDGREVPREEAYRDDPVFVPAARQLLASRTGDDAPLGAWLLGTLPETRRPEAETALVEALAHADERAAFEAALALAEIGGAASLDPLRHPAASASPAEVRAAARFALAEVGRRTGVPPSPLRAVPRDGPALAAGFRRGVSWWMSEGRADAGHASFRRLASLGVTWVSHPHLGPAAARARRAGPRAARPPLRLPRPRSPREERARRGPAGDGEAAPRDARVRADGEERRVLRGPDGPARRALLARLESQIAHGEHLQHNRIAMRNEADWRRWFESYAAYVLPYARDAQAAGADMFCVGREIDSTVVAPRGRLAPSRRAHPRPVPRAAHLLGELRHLAGDRVLGRPRLHRRLRVLPARRARRSLARRPRGGLGPGARAARAGLATASAGPCC